MHIITPLTIVALVFIVLKLFDVYFGRFGRRSRFMLWKKFRNGPVTIYGVRPRNRLEARGGICPATNYPKLKLAFAAETDMKYLSELDLPSGIDISSQIKKGEVMSLHFHGRQLCQIERRKGSTFLKDELYALVDAQRADTRFFSSDEMIAAA